MAVGTAPDLLLERGRELEALKQSLASAKAGRGTMTLVVGPAGAGKSRLLEAAREMARADDFMTLAARASELERDLAFGVVTQLMDVPNDAFPGAERPKPDVGYAMIQHYRDAVVKRLCGASDAPRPALALVDDLQWADDPSLRFLCHLAMRLERLPLAVVGAVRTGAAGGTNSPLELLLADRASFIVSPQPLSRTAVGELLRAACAGDASEALVDACVRVTGGNPFYVVELVRTLADGRCPVSVEVVEQAAPESVLRALMARLASLGPAASRLARALAVVGDGATLHMAARLAEIPMADAEEAADALCRADFLARGEPLSFTHPLIASALRSDMGAFARAGAHQRAAELLAADGVPVERIAPHLLHTAPRGDPRVVGWLRHAADVASRRGDPGLAGRLLVRALEEGPDEAARGPILLELAEAEAQAGSPLALDHLRAALGAMTDVRRRAEVRLALARTLHHAGEYAEEARLAGECRRELPPDDPLQERALSTWLAAAVLDPPLRNTAVPATMARLVDAVRAGNPPSDPALLALISSWLTAFDEPAELVTELARAAFVADPLVDGDSRGAAAGFAASTLVYVDALDVAEPLLDAATEAARKRGSVIALSVVTHFRAQVNLHRGHLEAALADALLSLDIYRDGWAGSAWSTPTLTLVHLARADLDAASETVRMGEAADHDRVDWPMLVAARATLHLARNRPVEALGDALAAGRQWEESWGRTSARVFDWVRIAALAAHAAGRTSESRRLADEALRRGQVAGGRHLGTALVAAGIVAGGQRGMDLLEEACLVLQGSPCRLESARAQLELGIALHGAGRHKEAREPLYRALELAEPMGAAGLVARARSELGKLGLRPRRAARRGVSSLTPSERRVAELAAAGLTTAQIANDLVVNRKTVEDHLTHIYAKLGVHSREALAAEIDATPARATPRT